METMTPMAVISLMPNTKDQQINFSEQIVNSVISGETNALELDTYLKSIEDTIKLIRKNRQVQGAALDEADKYPEKVIELNGAEITKVSRSIYDFSNEVQYQALKDIETASKQDVKNRETFLKSLQSEVADPVTGEIIELPTKKTTDYLKITFK